MSDDPERTLLSVLALQVITGASICVGVEVPFDGSGEIEVMQHAVGEVVKRPSEAFLSHLKTCGELIWVKIVEVKDKSKHYRVNYNEECPETEPFFKYLSK